MLNIIIEMYNEQDLFQFIQDENKESIRELIEKCQQIDDDYIKPPILYKLRKIFEITQQFSK